MPPLDPFAFGLLLGAMTAWVLAQTWERRRWVRRLGQELRMSDEEMQCLWAATRWRGDC